MKKFVFIIFGLICLCSCSYFNHDNSSSDFEVRDEYPVGDYRHTPTKYELDMILYDMAIERYKELHHQTTMVLSGPDGEYHEWVEIEENLWDHSPNCKFCKEKENEHIN